MSHSRCCLCGRAKHHNPATANQCGCCGQPWCKFYTSRDCLDPRVQSWCPAASCPRSRSAAPAPVPFSGPRSTAPRPLPSLAASVGGRSTPAPVPAGVQSRLPGFRELFANTQGSLLGGRSMPRPSVPLADPSRLPGFRERFGVPDNSSTSRPQDIGPEPSSNPRRPTRRWSRQEIEDIDRLWSRDVHLTVIAEEINARFGGAPDGQSLSGEQISNAVMRYQLNLPQERRTVPLPNIERQTYVAAEVARQRDETLRQEAQQSRATGRLTEENRAPLGSVAGDTFASLFAKAWWPCTFYSFAVVLTVTAFLTPFFVPAPQPEFTQAKSRLETAKRLDPLGSVVGVLSLVFVNFAWNQAPVVGWNEPYVYLALMIGVILAPVFFYIEAHISSFPLIPIAFVTGDIGMILACVGCGWSCFGIFLYYIWQFFELLRHASPLLASAWYSTNGVSGAIAALLTGLLLGRVGPAKAMIFALLSFVIGTVFTANAPVSQIYWAQSFLCLLIIPFGMDISFPAATVIVSDRFPPEHQGIGASLVNTLVNWSIAMGLGLAGTVEVHVNHGGNTQEDLLLGREELGIQVLASRVLGLIISVVFWLREVKTHGGDDGS